MSVILLKSRLSQALSLMFLVLACLLSPSCFALGFGEIKLYSYLNEPLQAEIELLAADNFEPERILVSLASAQEFKRAGLERPFFLSQLQFDVSRSSQKTTIKISSKTPIKQPYLDFLLDLSWPGGRLLRGYTVLLDPPPSNRNLNVSTAVPRKAQTATVEIKDLSQTARRYATNKSSTQEHLETLFEPLDKTTDLSINEPLTPMTVVSKVSPIPSERADNQSQELPQGPIPAELQLPPEKRTVQTPEDFPNPNLPPTTSLPAPKLSFQDLSFFLLGLGFLLVCVLAIVLFSRQRGEPRPKKHKVRKHFKHSGPNVGASSNFSSTQDLNGNIKPFTNEMTMKLDLARHYMEMNETEHALPLLDDIITRGSAREKDIAEQLLTRIRPQQSQY